jgi:hypothetical protein
MQNQIETEEKFIKPPNTPAEEFGWNGYHDLSSIYEWMEWLAGKFDFITVLNIGNSYNGVPIKGVKLSRKAGNTAVFVEGGIHAR